MPPTAATRPAADDDLADLADVLLTVARELQWADVAETGLVHLTGTETTVMRHVDRNPGTSPGAVATATGLHRSNLSTVLRSLEAKGLVERQHDVHDGRSVVLRPTALAERNVALLRSGWAARLRRALARGGDDGALTALQLLRRLEEGLAAQR